MAAWPTVEEVKAYFAKLDKGAQLDARVTRSRARSITRIRAKMSDKYDVTAWGDASTTVPQQLTELSYWLAFGFSGYAQHTSSSESASDRVAKDVLTDALAELDEYASGAVAVLDDNGNPIPQRDHESRTGLLLVEEDIFGLRSPEDWGISLARDGTWG